MFKIYKNRKILITGHTGFKGSWLTLWLESLGAKVIGYSVDIPTKPSLFELVKPKCVDIRGDIRNFKKFNSVVQKYKPEIIFHLAAQPIVKKSYTDTVETYSVNVMGTANVLESLKKNTFVKAVVAVTTDKVYLNNETGRCFCENDPLGGYDPYSASKACCEIVVSSYRDSFFNVKEYGKKHKTLIASARAGNVIGGGDFASDRLIPDFVKAAVSKKTLLIRNPKAIRPWQHVLESLNGYLMLGEKLLQGKKQFAQSWNFGPEKNDIRNVEQIARSICKNFGNEIKYKKDSKKHPHEACCLKLDITKSKKILKWTPKWDVNKALDKISFWIRCYAVGHDMKKTCFNQIKEYINE